MSEDHSTESAPVPTAAQRRHAHLIRLGIIGLAGAITVNVLNEGVRQVLPHAPRVEVIGERALTESLKALHVTPPQGKALYR